MSVVSVSAVLNKEATYEDVWENGGTAPVVLFLSAALDGSGSYL